MSAELGVLEEVELRAAWTHEGHAFTPWLADHLDRLSEAIGVPLELEGKEVAVEAFAADILARNLADDSLVLIENQLEETDHRHLGQILTYLAGLGAQTVIWIAARFREPHLSAINWLNDHTADPFAFFAVRVKVVRIGDSPLAPVFEVIARPNEWDRQLQTIARESREMSEIGQYRRDFWAHLAARHPGEGPETSYAASSYWDEVGDSGLAVVRFVGRGQVGIFIRGPRGSDPADVYDTLGPHEPDLIDRLGVPIGTSNKGHLFVKTLDIDGTDPSNWDRMADWLVEQAKLYRDALAAKAEA